MWLLCETTYVLQATFKTRIWLSSLYKLADVRDTEEITQSTECLTCIHEDLSSIPRAYVKTPGMAACA